MWAGPRPSRADDRGRQLRGRVTGRAAGLLARVRVDRGRGVVLIAPDGAGGRGVGVSFELVLDQLRIMATSTSEFETQRLVDQCDIPKHEPGIVVAVLAKYGLLHRIRRGRWRFDDPASFGERAAGVWQRLPRE